MNLVRWVQAAEKNQVATQKNEQITILVERQEDQILADIQKHDVQADYDRSIQKLSGIIESQRMEIDHTITGCDQSRRDQAATSRRTVRTKSGSS